MVSNNNAADVARNWLKLGVSPIPLAGRSKAADWSRPDTDKQGQPIEVTWRNYQATTDNIDDYFKPNHNVAIRLGSDSSDIVDIDLDCDEVITLAPHLFPETTWRFGRGDNGTAQTRHLLIKCTDAKPFKLKWPKSYKLEGDKQFMLEVLGTGNYVVGPGSIHKETGQRIQWHTKPSKNILTLSPAELTQRLHRLAGAALLVRTWDQYEGARHFVMRDLAGACHHAGWPDNEIHQTLGAIQKCTNDPDKRDRKAAVVDTLKKAAEDGEVTGLPSLSEYIDSETIEYLKKWWGLGVELKDTLTFGGKALSQQPVSTWPELLEFSDEILSTDTQYPVDSLGTVMSGAVRSIRDIQQAPASLVAQSILTAASSVAHSIYSVIDDERVIPLSLWLILVGRGGERKSTTDRLAIQQVIDRMELAIIDYRIKLQQWVTECKDKDAEPGPKPRKPNWLITGGTTEGIIKSLALSSPFATYSTADAGAWFGGYSMREGRDMSTASILSDLWTGVYHNSAKASDDETQSMFNRRLSLSLMLQPNIAADVFSSALLQGQGFLSRCLPSFPASTIGTRHRKPRGQRGKDKSGLKQFNTAINRLIDKGADYDMITGDLTFNKILLDDDADDLFTRIYNDIEIKLIGDYESILDVANKMAEQVLRLAGIRAVIDAYASTDSPGIITLTKSHIADAKVLVDYYLNEWLNLAGKLQSHRRDVFEPRQLLEWMQQRRTSTGESIFSLRNIYRSGPRLVRNKADYARVLMQELVRRGYVRQIANKYELRPADEK